MTEKQAFCCFNCTPPCPCEKIFLPSHGACNECPECCKDCGDTSTCKSLAYLDKNDNLYGKYDYNATWSSRSNSTGTQDPDCNQDASTFESFVINVSIPHGEAAVYNGSIFYRANNSFCNSVDCPDFYYQSRTEIIDSKFQTTVESTTDFEPCGEVTTTTTEGGYSAIIPIIEDSFCLPCYNFNYQCVDEEQILPAGENYPSYVLTVKSKSTGFGHINYYQSLKLYNHKGQEIGNPWSILPPPSPYDRCYPIRVVNAPGCHFFHP